ncbi:alpha-methylacyl-CoA racemase [Sitophilus oryzae]|uniref:Alpha-methylacyl-CoA racemase n=1 Tax=Sitophilus oryzae TaxID=7048 RepID=A0A6J2Y3S6_SITOR|nr:alpha-methylacyl-CoA racemase [Sitophilus oryzae]
MALIGIKVIEFAGLAPVPFCGMILADFGATVIRIDRINSSSDIDCLGNGKRSIAMDLKNKEATKIIKKLVKTSDVSIEPFRPGIMEKLGLGPNVLMQENPKLIYARLTGYGQSGPYCTKAGHDINYLAMSGLLSLFGRKNENPIFPVNLAADFGGGGLICALGIIMALFERQSSGLGQVIDVNMVNGTAYLGSFLYRSQKLPIWGNKRGENILDSGAPFYDTYKTKDAKYISIGAIEPQFYNQLLEGLCLTGDDAPQFDFEKSRKAFTNRIAEKTRDEWCQIFEKLDACVTPVLELNEAPNHVHNNLQNSFTSKNEEYSPNPAPILSRTPAVSTAPLKRPKIGEHTYEILKELKFDNEYIDHLQKEGVIQLNPSKL